VFPAALFSFRGEDALWADEVIYDITRSLLKNLRLLRKHSTACEKKL